MNVAFAAFGGGVATLLYWRIALACAARRRLSIGTLHPGLPVFAAVGAAAGSLHGAPEASILAVAGTAVAGVVDARTGSIFDPLAGSLLATSLVLGAFEGLVSEAAGGTLVVGGAFVALYSITRGRGIGLGDVKLGIAIGAALGPTSGLMASGLAFVFGGAYAGWLLITRRAARRTEIRFAPFIAAGTFAALILRAGYQP
jgi:prepilin signal peptidase PulO-like enzyme (type II secretory pathway)